MAEYLSRKECNGFSSPLAECYLCVLSDTCGGLCIYMHACTGGSLLFQLHSCCSDQTYVRHDVHECAAWSINLKHQGLEWNSSGGRATQESLLGVRSKQK